MVEEKTRYADVYAPHFNIIQSIKILFNRCWLLWLKHMHVNLFKRLSLICQQLQNIFSGASNLLAINSEWET